MENEKFLHGIFPKCKSAAISSRNKLVENKAFEKYLTNQTNFDETVPEKYRLQAKLAVKDEYNFDFIEMGIDLLLYHRRQRCLIAIDLKIGEFKPEYAGKMQFYPLHCLNYQSIYRCGNIGFDMRNGPAFTFSQGTFMHEGSGACSLYIDPKEELVAAWIIPFAKEGWFSRALFNVQNIIWSGLI